MKKIFVSLALLSGLLYANSVLVAVGAGYKRPLAEVIKNYELENKSEKINYSAGNMKQVSSLVKNNKSIALAIGEKGFLVQKEKIPFKSFMSLGSGKVVIAYKKGIKMSDIKDLLKLKKIAMPNAKGAVYGIRGKQFLENSGLLKQLKDRLLVVANVPQTASYVVRGEVDAGIINLSSALSFKGKIGGYILVPKQLYKPITIGVGELDGCSKNKACQRFLSYLKSKKAKAVFAKYGL